MYSSDQLQVAILATFVLTSIAWAIGLTIALAVRRWVPTISGAMVAQSMRRFISKLRSSSAQP